jgi:hypothetical protein
MIMNSKIGSSVGVFVGTPLAFAQVLRKTAQIGCVSSVF